ncbi:alpha/beta fold hydrolase [Hwanghaeella grinnelliae]|uniref:Alpha/beta fold hydrolase n=1 Tax=Hwanghaeella grinnelliae TaxID=2500179 RepID=A0A437QQR7_9PROT|nr:alpha/beta fold hydrolase [Hwanghaeella grinnelliae]RVU36779.1 alpha/beta fold hydrolase [Hwanghaeella grinnelliae]
MRAKALKRIGIGLAIIVVLAGGVLIAARTLDPINVYYKRLKASSPYQYEEINPDLLKTDPAALITIDTAEDVAAARQALLGWIYGTDPAERRVAKLYYPRAGWSHASEILDWDGLGGVAQYYINVRPDLISYAYLLTPLDGNSGPGAGKAVIYHNGMASTFVAARDWLEPLLKQGWTVLAFNQLGYGESARELHCDKQADGSAVPEGVPCLANLQLDLAQLDTPVALHVEPVLAGVDLLKGLGFAQIDALGFSAGAATVTFAAAIDPRLRRTVAAAGILPPYLREGQDELFGIARELAESGPISFLDLFILAGAGEGRAYHQLFNRYDRCCYRNVKGRHYEEVVKKALAGAGEGGQFTVTIDESHARHAISSGGARAVIDFLTD